MDSPETKPELTLGCFSRKGNCRTVDMPLSQGSSYSLQLTMGNNDCKSSPLHTSNSDQSSQPVCSTNHQSVLETGPTLNLTTHSETSDSSNNTNNEDTDLQMVCSVAKREYSFLADFPRPKKRKAEEGDILSQQHTRRHSSSTYSNGNPSNRFLQNLSNSPSCSEGDASPKCSIPKPLNQYSCTALQSLAYCHNVIQDPGSYPDLESRKAAVRAWGNQPLSVIDPDLWDVMEREKQRQWKGIELIASENFVCQAVIEALGSHLTNKYSEGMPGSRYYGGNEYIDQIESLCRERALVAFRLDPEKWGVNVQPYSCTSANFAVYTALLQPKDRIMGLDSPSGGHLSHGYYTFSGKKVSGASIFFESLPYKVNPHTGYIDFEKLEEKALDFRPKILICGGSSYPREWDYARFRQIADKCGAVLMCDMAQISGLVAAEECSSPFDYCDIVTSTTHKSLRGPRGGMIFYRKGPKPRKRASSLNQGEESEQYDFDEKINFAVFPSLQGGPHNNHVAALAVAFKQAATSEYKAYMQQVKKNAQALASALMKWNCRLVTGGTDNHLLLWDLRPLCLTGNRFEKVCEMCHITVNKNAVYGDSGAMAPGGVRIGLFLFPSLLLA
eukprot:TRINITY_DN28381_c0_g1_i3.p1 TRINITY_DN28381_c0_g1~~TRINITY_DN28381_c0_g1_i3.p1  ORF type:complete len:614 (-),score=105.66 TRINITY_DN28381_c0_g1_i3:172-2013(-)